MDDITRSLIAVGASAAVNCRPCLQFHLAAARSLAIPEAELAVAMEIGLGVGEGANRKTREYVADLVAGAEPGADDACTASGPGEVPTCSLVDR